MQLAAAKRLYDHIHEDLPWHDGSFKVWRKEWSTRTPFHYLDGVRIWIAGVDHSPDDDFLTDPRTQQQSGGEPDGSTP